MRYQLLKLKKGHSTKAERRFAELCKQEHIPFKAKVKTVGLEIDFVIGRYAIEIDGHQQKSDRNFKLIRAGYIPVHIPNRDITPQLTEWLHKLNGSF